MPFRRVESLSRLLEYHPNRFMALRDDDAWADAAQQLGALQRQDPVYRLISIASLIHAQFEEGEDVLKREELDSFSPARVNAMFGMNYDPLSMLETAMMGWMKGGRQIFDLSAIATLFKQADATHVPLKQIEFRYPAFYVHWGADAALAGPEPGRVVDGCYVSVDRLDSGALELTLCFASTLPHAHRWDSASLLANLVVDGEGADSFTLNTEEREDATFGDIIRDVRGGSYEPETARWVPHLPALLSMVANALCYLCSDDAEVTTEYPPSAPERLVRQTTSHRPTQQRSAESKLEALGYRRIHLCGRMLARRLRLEELAGTGREMPTHWRSGHWRHMRVGKGRKVERPVWIWGVMVNADKGDAVPGHIYVADDVPQNSGNVS